MSGVKIQVWRDKLELEPEKKITLTKWTISEEHTAKFLKRIMEEDMETVEPIN